MKKIYYILFSFLLNFVFYEVSIATNEIVSKKLDNGLEVIVIENHVVPLVTIEVAVKNGAYTEPPEYNGLSHLYEHMFFKGNEALPDQESYMARQRELGMVWNGMTSSEGVRYYFTLSKEKLKEGLIFMNYAIRTPRFDQTELEKERQVVLGEYDRAESNPSWLLNREVDKKLWYKYHSYKDIIGDRKVIENASREEMLTIQKKFYIPNNSALIIAGDVNPKEVFKLVSEIYGNWQKGDDPFLTSPLVEHPPLQKNEAVIVNGPVKVASLIIKFQGPDTRYDVQSTYAADIFSTILANPSSNFQKNLVDSQKVLKVDLNYYTQRNVGPITISAQIEVDRLNEAISSILKEIDKFNQPLYYTDKEIEDAKSFLETEEIYNKEQVSQFALNLGFWWASTGIDYYLTYVDNINKVTREDINRYIEKYIQNRPYVIGLLISKEDQERVKITEEALLNPLTSEDNNTISLQSFEVNGLKVIFKKTPSNNVISANLYILGGVNNYSLENAGIENLMLLVARKGGTKNFDKDTLNRELSRLGTEIKTSTDYDYSKVSMKTTKANFEYSWKIFTDIIMNPLFDNKEFEITKRQIINEIKSETESPDSYIRLIARELFFKDHPYMKKTNGTEESVSKIEREDIINYHKNLMVTSKMFLVLVGDLEKEEIESKIISSLGKFPKGKYNKVSLPQFSMAKSSNINIVERELPTNYILGLFSAPKITDDDYPAFLLSIDILDHKLFEEVRTKRNMTYAIRSGVTDRLSNYAMLYFTTQFPNETLKIIFQVIEKMQNELISEKELQDKINEFITHYYLKLETNEAQTDFLGRYEILGGGYENTEKFIERLKKVTPFDIQKSAKDYIKNISYGVLGKSSEIDSNLFTSK